MRLFPFLLFVSLVPVAAPQGRVASPALGYAFDPALGAIRAIRGIPGAALLAEPLDAGGALVEAAISPTHDFALAVFASDRRARIIRWQDGESLSVLPLENALNAPDGFVFSPSGSAAVLHDRISKRLQLITGLPASPVLREIAFPATRAIAVADNGVIALADDGGVRIVHPDLDSFILPVSGARALAFSPVARDLLAVTGSGALYFARGIERGLDIREVPYDSASLADPVAVRFSDDGSSAAIAAASGALASVDLAAGVLALLSCDCSPTGIHPLTRGGLLRVTDISDRPLFLFDTAPDRPRVWFVPAVDRRTAQ